MVLEDRAEEFVQVEGLMGEVAWTERRAAREGGRRRGEPGAEDGVADGVASDKAGADMTAGRSRDYTIAATDMGCDNATDCDSRRPCAPLDSCRDCNRDADDGHDTDLRQAGLDPPACYSS